MSWQGILGHDRIVEQFQRGLERRRLPSALLFVGPAGVGKRTFAQKLAEALLCENHDEEQLDPCGQCQACQQVQAQTHPDLIILSKPKDKSFIPVDLFIGDREHRMREGLCHDIALKPYRGGRKIAIIDDADYLNQEGANCLLKTLEEPPPKSVLILITSSEQNQLPTIRSRCQTVRFRPLLDEHVAELLEQHGIAANEPEAKRLAALAQGNLQRITQPDATDLHEFRETLFDYLCHDLEPPSSFAKTLVAFVDEAGRDATARRQRMQHVTEMATELFRNLMWNLCGRGFTTSDRTLEKSVTLLAKSWSGSTEKAADCVQRCLDAQAQIAANANQTTLLECWLDDLDFLIWRQN